MPSIYQFSDLEIIGFALVFIRCLSFVMTIPVLGSSNIPQIAKILFSLVVTMIIYPSVLVKGLPNNLMDEGLIFLVAKEALVGALLGFISRMFFMAISAAGNIIALSIGLSAASMYNPQMDSQGTVVEQFFFAIAMIVFLTFNGHHLLLSGLVQSYQALPLSFDGLDLKGVKMAASLGQEILVISLKISAPVLVSILISNLSMGIIGRAVPQINVLVTSLHLTILVGLLVIIISLPLMVGEMNGLQQEMAGRLFEIMKNL